MANKPELFRPGPLPAISGAFGPSAIPLCLGARGTSVTPVLGLVWTTGWTVGMPDSGSPEFGCPDGTSEGGTC